MTDEQNIIALLRSWCFDEKPVKPAPEDLEELRRLNLLRFCRFFYAEVLTDPRDQEVQRHFLAGSVLDLHQMTALRKITGILNAAEIPFCPVKGMMLRRFYPHPGLRTRGDIDLLLPPDKTRQAAMLLRKAGWNMPVNYWHPHHEPIMRKGSVQLELHHTLPGFRKADMPRVWPLLHRSESGLELPPELNLLMLFAHFGSHDWRFGVKVLLDFGYIVKHCGAPDWEKIDRYCREFKLYSPALFFAAFPDFFPAEMMPPQQFSDGDKQLMREMTLDSHSGDILQTVMGVTNRFTAEWWRQRLNGLSLTNVRRQTGNVKRNYGRLWLDYFRINVPKIWYFCSGLKQTDRKCVRLIHALKKK